MFTVIYVYGDTICLWYWRLPCRQSFPVLSSSPSSVLPRPQSLPSSALTCPQSFPVLSPSLSSVLPCPQSLPVFSPSLSSDLPCFQSFPSPSSPCSPVSPASCAPSSSSTASTGGGWRGRGSTPAPGAGRRDGRRVSSPHSTTSCWRPTHAAAAATRSAGSPPGGAVFLKYQKIIRVALICMPVHSQKCQTRVRICLSKKHRTTYAKRIQVFFNVFTVIKFSRVMHHIFRRWVVVENNTKRCELLRRPLIFNNIFVV